MIYIQGEETGKDKYKVHFIHYIPDELSDEEKENGLVIKKEDYPDELEHKEGFSNPVFYSLETGEVWREYEEYEPTEEEIEEMEKERMKKEIADLWYMILSK